MLESSSSQILSQVPFNIQLPLPQSWGSPVNLCRKQLPPDTPTFSLEPDTNSIVQSQSECLASQQLANDTEAVPAVSAQAEQELDQFMSSIRSIECQPLNPVAEDDPALDTTQNLTPYAQGRDNTQPFPLVEWIKRIRSETPKQWPTVSLRWTRTVSKKQSAILDSDEAWVPSLAGRPTRPGTVPIELLSALTAEADRVTRDVVADKDHGLNVKGNEAIPASPRPSRSHTDVRVSPEAYIRGQPSNQSSPQETVDASQWSSSPPERPRLQAPLDTSPVRAAEQIDDARASRQIPENNLSGKAIGEHDERDFYLESHSTLLHDQILSSQPPHASERAATPDEGQHETPALHVPSLTGNMQDDGVRSNSDRSANRQPRVEAQRKIHVKDTPYPAKVPFQHTPSHVIPQSSFVGATYPEPPCSRLEAQRSARVTLQESVKSIDKQPSPHIAHTHSSQDQRSSTKRCYGETSAHGPAIDPQLSRLINHSALFDTRVAPQAVTISDEADATIEARPAKRIRVPYTDPVFQAFDNRRILERRMLRKGFPSKPVEAAETELQPVDDPEMGSKSTSIASSPPASNRPSNAFDSERSHTSATHISLHNLVRISTPARKTASRGSVVMDVPDATSISQVLIKYRAAYPNYRGDQKSFVKAIHLLLELRSQDRELHPSLWDDFIHRFAEDYRVYLQNCSDDNENAMSYQAYYRDYVDDPRRSQKIVTMRSLQALLRGQGSFGSKTPSSARRSSRGSNKQDDRDVVVRDEEPHDLQDTVGSVAHRACATPEIQETQPVTVYTQTAQRDAQTATEVPAAALGEAMERHKEMSNSHKRRGLPWTLHEPTHPTSPEQQLRQPLTVSSSARPRREFRVEEWLWRSRAAGAASPELEVADLPVNKSALTSRDPVATRSVHESVPPTTFREQVVESVEVSDGCASVKPESVFSRFAKYHADLQDQNDCRSSAEQQRRIPIDIYTW